MEYRRHATPWGLKTLEELRNMALISSGDRFKAITASLEELSTLPKLERRKFVRWDDSAHTYYWM